MVRRISSQSDQTGNYSSYHLDNHEFIEKVGKVILHDPSRSITVRKVGAHTNKYFTDTCFQCNF